MSYRHSLRPNLPVHLSQPSVGLAVGNAIAYTSSATVPRE
jgi:hypothetical protein